MKIEGNEKVKECCGQKIISEEIYNPAMSGEGRRPWATTISPSVPQISFFLFWQPWATTISPSVPAHLTLPAKTTFLNGTFRAFKVWFKKKPAASLKKAQLKPFFQLYLWLISCCVEFLNCFTMKFLTNLTEYCILKYHKVG